MYTKEVYQYQLGIVREFIRHSTDDADVSVWNLDTGATLVKM